MDRALAAKTPNFMNLAISTQTQMTVIAGAVIVIIALVIFLVRAERQTKRRYSK